MIACAMASGIIGPLPVQFGFDGRDAETQRVAPAGREEVIAVLLITVAALVVGEPGVVVVMDGVGRDVEAVIPELFLQGGEEFVVQCLPGPAVLELRKEDVVRTKDVHVDDVTLPDELVEVGQVGTGFDLLLILGDEHVLQVEPVAVPDREIHRGSALKVEEIAAVLEYSFLDGFLSVGDDFLHNGSLLEAHLWDEHDETDDGRHEIDGEE